MTPLEAQREWLTGGTQKSVQRKRHGDGRVGLPSTHLCNAGYGSRDQVEFSLIERKEKKRMLTSVIWLSMGTSKASLMRTLNIRISISAP